MHELDTPGMERDPVDALFCRLLLVVLPVSDHAMANCRKLHPDLIL
jgi:hypothetical protein